MISIFRLAWRCSCVVGVIAGFLLESFARDPWMSFYRWDESRKRSTRCGVLQRWARLLIRALGFEVQVLGVWPSGPTGGALWVANHLSFWDVVAIASREPVVFVTSYEVRDTPVIGWVSRAAGCVFVDRRDRARKLEEKQEIAQILREGGTVMLFPEATSTDGSSVLPFKKSFFSPAIDSGRPVVPLCINYAKIDGRPVDRFNRDWVFYYGDQKFHAQLLRALRLRNLEISIEILAPIPTCQGVTDREWLVKQAYNAVVSRFTPVREPLAV